MQTVTSTGEYGLSCREEEAELGQVKLGRASVKIQLECIRAQEKLDLDSQSSNPVFCASNDYQQGKKDSQ